MTKAATSIWLGQAALLAALATSPAQAQSELDPDCIDFDFVPALLADAKAQLAAKDQLTGEAGPLVGPYYDLGFSFREHPVAGLDCRYDTALFDLDDGEGRIRCKRSMPNMEDAEFLRDSYELCLLTQGWERNLLNYQKDGVRMDVLAMPARRDNLPYVVMTFRR